MSSAATSAEKSSPASRARAIASRTPRPTLRVLEGPVQRVRRIPFLVSCMALLCLGLLSLLGLNIGLARGSYEVTSLQKQQQQLLETSQNLNEQLDRASSPAQVSSRARALGMVPSGTPVFIQLSDGRILGDPKASAAQTKAPSADLSQPYVTTTAAPSKPGASASASSSPTTVIAYPTYGTAGPATRPTPSGSSSGAPASSGAASTSAGASGTPSPSSTGAVSATSSPTASPASSGVSATPGPSATSGSVPSAPSGDGATPGN